MKDQSVNYGGGISFFTLLGVLFIGLKLTGYITWPWWAVLLPIYGPIVLALVILAIAGIIYLIVRD